MSTETTADPVSHPPHYTGHPSGIECIEVTRHMGFNLGNAIKYVWRADLKENAIQDLEKAVWYIQDEIAKREKETATEGETVPLAADGTFSVQVQVNEPVALPQANLLPHMEHCAAVVAYQTARAEYFRYAPEIKYDPEGVKRLKDAMHAARGALNPFE